MTARAADRATRRAGMRDIDGDLPAVGAARRVRAPVVLGAVAVVATVVLVWAYLYFVRSLPGQRADDHLFGEAQHLPLTGASNGIRDAVPFVLAVVAAGCGVVALRRRRGRLVVVQLAGVVVSLGLAEVLKARLPRPFLGTFAYLENTFPSAHMALTVALALAVLALWPTGEPGERGRRAVRVAAAGGVLVLVLVEAVYNVAGFAHRPSDVLGGAALAVAVAAALACAGQALAGLRSSRGRP